MNAQTPCAPIGLIGGSGFYRIDSLQDQREDTVFTPWHAHLVPIVRGIVHNQPVVFIARHGKGHVYPPNAVPYAAHIDALKQCGVKQIIAFSACGSLHKRLAPGDFVVVDQFIDWTRARQKSFFGSGCVAHVGFAHPVCKRMHTIATQATNNAGVTTHNRGTYLAMDGPQFSTLAESYMYRNVWGADVIGMTNMPEAKLAREAELCYNSIAMVTDYDSWHPIHKDIVIEDVIACLMRNVDKAAVVFDHMVRLLAKDSVARGELCPCGCQRALDSAIITPPQYRDADLVRKLDTIAGRVLR